MAEETRQERQRRLARERKRRQRARQSLGEAAAARAADTFRRKLRLSQENEYEREMRKRKDRERIAERRRTSSLEETEERRKKEKERIAERRNQESEEAALQRRFKTAENMRRLRAGTRIRNVSATLSSSSSLNPSLITHHDPSSSLSQRPTGAACWEEETGQQFQNKYFENRQHKLMSRPMQPSYPVHTQMHAPQHLQVASSTLSTAAKPQSIFRQEQMMALPVELARAKSKSTGKPRPREKRLLSIANHQRNVMSNLASLWKSGKLCDAGIGNGSTTVKVHKLVLSAVCPKLLSVSNMDKISHKFLQVNFPEVVSPEALNAFAEYMYNGILDIDLHILAQLKIIAKRLDMEELETLCDSHLPSHFHPAESAAAATVPSTSASFSDIPFIQTTVPNPSMTSPFNSAPPTSLQSAQSINIPMDIKQEISENELSQLKINMATVFSQESEVASVVPNKSANDAGFGIKPVIKTEPLGPEDDKYGQWSRNNNNQAFISPVSFPLSSSIASLPIKSAERTIPFSETTDFKSTRLKVPPHSYEAPDISPLPLIKKARTKLNSTNENSVKPLGRTSDSQPPVNLEMSSSNSNNTVYPIRLFSAKGDNLPLLTKHSPDAMTLNSFIPKDKT